VLIVSASAFGLRSHWTRARDGRGAPGRDSRHLHDRSAPVYAEICGLRGRWTLLVPIAQTHPPNLLAQRCSSKLVPAFTTAVTRVQRPRRRAAIWTDYGQSVRSVDNRRAFAAGVDRDRARS
jgi:hypothetical protein